MQVANDVTSANELPSREARPGRRVNNSAAAGKLQGGELRKDCVEGALERGLAGGERGVRAAVVTVSKRAVAILESTSEEVSTADCRA